MTRHSPAYMPVLIPSIIGALRAEAASGKGFLRSVHVLAFLVFLYRQFQCFTYVFF